MKLYFTLNRKSFSIVFICSLIMIYLEQCSENLYDESLLDTITIEVNQESDRFIAFEDSFEDDQIFLPVRMEQNPISKDILILDQGNHSLFFFDEKGKYLKKIGGVGQGPGDLLKPFNMEIDDNGDIYILEGGNNRISIFNFNGEFINSLKVSRIFLQDRSKFVINNEKNVVFNLPQRKYYLTVFERDGNKKDICEIKHFDYPFSYRKGDTDTQDIIFAEGIPFLDSNDNYVLFLSHIPYVLIIDKNGDKLVEKNLETVLGITDYNSPEKRSFEGLHDYIYLSVRKSVNSYYIVRMIRSNESSSQSIYITKLDNEFNYVNNICLRFSQQFNLLPIEWPNILLLNNQSEFLFANPGDSEILKFFIKNN